MLPRIVLLMMVTPGIESVSADAGKTEDADPAVIPRPALMVRLPGEFQITESTFILVPPFSAEFRAVGEFFAAWLRAGTGFAIPVTDVESLERSSRRHIVMELIDRRPIAGGKASPMDTSPDRYQLRVEPGSILLRAATPRGLFHGVQTLRQLLPPEFETGAHKPDGRAWRVPGVQIGDNPRYRWRGMLLDCCRHFMTKEFVKRYIDLLAYHKMNVLHWHLTEDQGWRIEIKKYPKLTGVGAWRGQGDQRYGGFYSQDDIREIVAYAASRYVTVVPEIEMPGHCLAALASYPELSCTGGPFEVGTRWGIRKDVYCAGDDRTFEFLEGVLAEVLELFPSEFIHVGGDECPKDRWKACSKCQGRIKAEGLKDERQLQSYFIRRIERFLNSRGRRLVGWDEILEGGLAPNATVQSWRGMKGAVTAAQAGHDVIASPTSHCYLDYAQTRGPGEPTHMGFIDLKTAYSFEPTPPELTPEQASRILGAEANMWTEHAPQARVDHQVFPRLCALAEVMWSPAAQRDWDNFRHRLRTHYRRLDALGVTYCPGPR